MTKVMLCCLLSSRILQACCFLSLSGAGVSITCRRHRVSFPGGRELAVHGAAPETGRPHPGYEREKRQDGVQVPAERLRVRVWTDLSADWLVVE